MTKEEWKKIIEEQIKINDDYIPSFQTAIKILSEMLEERDRIFDMYIEGGAHPVVEFTSDRGAVNLKPNPLWKQWQEINVSCLAYLRDLGLTAAGLRKLQGQLPKPTEKNNFLDKWSKRVNLASFAAEPVKPKRAAATVKKATATKKTTKKTRTKKGTK